MSESVDAAALAERASRLPHAVLQAASSGRAATLDRFFDFVPNCYEFGERLVTIAGLVEGAIYVQMQLDRESKERPNAMLADYLRQVLFGRGYDRGLALSIVGRVGAKRPDGFRELLPNDPPNLTFIAERPRGSGNVFRAQQLRPVEDELFALIEHLSFMEGLRFVSESKDVFFRDAPLEMEPFLYWDGHGLAAFSALKLGDQPEVRCKGLTPDQPAHSVAIVGIKLRTRLADISSRLGGPANLLSVPHEIAQEPLSRSIFPLFADTYPMMMEFAQKVYDWTSNDTQYTLWCKPAFGDDEQAASDHVGDEAFITNAVIRECMEKDPVYVLERYFALEQRDYRDWLEWRLRNREDIDRVSADVNAAVEAYRGRLVAFYVDKEKNETEKRSLADQVEKFKMRLYAQKVARLVGFQMEEQRSEDEIADYYRRISIFHAYLKAGGSDDARIAAALLQIINSAEKILDFLIRFYEALRVYDPDIPSGLSPAGREHIDRVNADLSGSGLAKLLPRFKRLGQDDELRNRLFELTGREGIWPGQEEPPQFKVLWKLQDIRLGHRDNEGKESRPGLVHSTGIQLGRDVHEIVRDFLAFLEWLDNADGKKDSTWQIYPATLALHVVTVNRCGVTSVRYVLKRTNAEGEEDREITLYTRQRLERNAGLFYAVANLRKVHGTLWVNPVLLPTEELTL